VSRNCEFVARIDSDISEFQVLFDAATEFAKGSDRWAEIQPGYMSFHFESQDAYWRRRATLRRGLANAKGPGRPCRDQRRFDLLPTNERIRLRDGAFEFMPEPN
jgi:hypothetical protein